MLRNLFTFHLTLFIAEVLLRLFCSVLVCMKLKLMANTQLIVAVGVDMTPLDIRRRLGITAADLSCRFLQVLIEVSDYNTGDNEWRGGFFQHGSKHD